MLHNSAPRFRAQYSASPSSVGVICGEVEAIARELGIEGDQLDDVGLAVSQAATDAVVDGSARRDDPPVRVRVDVVHSKMLVTISGATKACLTFLCPTPAAHARGTLARLIEATRHVHDSAAQRLEEALLEQDRLGTSFDAAIGTSTEFGAYVRLQRAGEQVAARQAWLNWVDNESYHGLNAGPFELATARASRATSDGL
jgi:hypothetical protein